MPRMNRNSFYEQVENWCNVRAAQNAYPDDIIQIIRLTAKGLMHEPPVSLKELDDIEDEVITRLVELSKGA